MKVYTVRAWARTEPSDQNAARLWSLPDGFNEDFIIVAESESNAKAIAYSCVAGSLYPQPEANELSVETAAKFVNLSINNKCIFETMSARQGLIGSGDIFQVAKVYGYYISNHDDIPAPPLEP
jgi:hypothetical protein